MKLFNGQYEAQPHIAHELIKFPNQLTKVQVQQFLGIVNYFRDFVPQLSQYTVSLEQMLRKDPPA